MSGYNDRYYRREKRQGHVGVIVFLFIVGFALYVAVDSGWLTTNTVTSLLPGETGQLPSCEQNNFTPPCVTLDDTGQIVPAQQAVGRTLIFVDGGGNPIVGMPVMLWQNGQEIQSVTNERGEILVYTEGFDPENRESYIVYGDTSSIINGRSVIVVQ